MSGIVGREGSKSGIIGASYSDMVLLHTNEEQYTSGTYFDIGANARGVGVGAHGSGDLFQTDFHYYKVYLAGFGVAAVDRMILRGLNTSGAVLDGWSWYYSFMGYDSGGTTVSNKSEGNNMMHFTGIDLKVDGEYSSAPGGTSTRGNNNIEMTIFGPASNSPTGVNWIHSQVFDVDGDLITNVGSGMFNSTSEWEGMRLGTEGETLQGYVNISIYGLRGAASGG